MPWKAVSWVLQVNAFLRSEPQGCSRHVPYELGPQKTHIYPFVWYCCMASGVINAHAFKLMFSACCFCGYGMPLSGGLNQFIFKRNTCCFVCLHFFWNRFWWFYHNAFWLVFRKKVASCTPMQLFLQSVHWPRAKLYLENNGFLWTASPKN